MGLQWSNGGQRSEQVYNEAQVASILGELGLDIVSETEQVFIIACPFHNNLGSPAFAVNKESGLFICFNPSCAEKGTLERLIALKTGKTGYSATRFIHKFSSAIDYQHLIEKELEPVEFAPFDNEILKRLKRNFPHSEGEKYMLSRGFTKETLDYFDIGYSSVQDAVTVPMHDIHGEPLGLISRAVHEKVFKNSTGLPKSKTAWNIHRAKKEGNTVIVCESSFDVMKIHQAGYPNAIALLGGSLGRYIVEQLNRTFSTFIIFTDMDEAGRKLGQQIEEKMKFKKILWAGINGHYPTHGEIIDNFYREFPCKDATDMSSEQIRKCLQGALTSMEYSDIIST